MNELEFRGVCWDERRVIDHDGRPWVTLLRESYTFRVPGATDTICVPTGLFQLLIGMQHHTGNFALCIARLDEYRRDNPDRLSDVVLALIDGFLKEGEATDGTASVPPPGPGD
jgi:hypothetical protein